MDHGSVYTPKAYLKLCKHLKVIQSMGAMGTSADNSLAKSSNTALKRELLAGGSTFPDQATAYRAVLRWAKRHNTRRRHSAIGNISPNTYEAATSATLAEAAQPNRHRVHERGPMPVARPDIPRARKRSIRFTGIRPSIEVSSFRHVPLA